MSDKTIWDQCLAKYSERAAAIASGAPRETVERLDREWAQLHFAHFGEWPEGVPEQAKVAS